jgi:hypothetical protein
MENVRREFYNPNIEPPSKPFTFPADYQIIYRERDLKVFIKKVGRQER